MPVPSSGEDEEATITLELRRRLAAITAPYAERDGPDGFPALMAAEAKTIAAMPLSRRQLAESVAAYRRKSADQEAISLIILEALQASEALRGTAGIAEELRRGLETVDEEAIRSDTMRQQAALARQAREPLILERHEQLRNAILAEAGTTPLVASRAFAESLVDGVQARFGSKDGASAGSIERAIRRILEERR